MRLLRISTAVVAGCLALSLGACASDSPTPATTSASMSSTQAADQVFPVHITHAFGETVIEKKPERVATIGWSNQEVPLALGVQPVGFEKVVWGDDDNNGILPWVEEKLEGTTPVLFDATDSIPFEAIANTNPDVILAAYSGITKEDYEQLSKIAPTVAYPDKAWGTSLKDTVLMDSKALGLEKEGEALLADLNQQISDAMDAHPALKDKAPVFAFFDESDLSQVGVYTSFDPRMSFLLDAGMREPSLLKSFANSSSFYEQVSAEKPELFNDVDLFIIYGTNDEGANQALLAKLQQDPLLSRIPAIAKGHVVFLGENPLAAAANPSPLSIPWGINDYFSKLAAPLT